MALKRILLGEPGNGRVRTRSLARVQYDVTVGTTDTLFLGPNPRRRAVTIIPPAAAEEYDDVISSLSGGVATDVLTEKLIYTVPAGRTAEITTAVCRGEGGNATNLFRHFRGATNQGILEAAAGASAIFGGFLYGRPADEFRWRTEIAGIAGSQNSFAIYGREYRIVSRFTVSFTGAAILDRGLTLSPGGEPVTLTSKHIGNVLREEIRAISADAAQTVSVIEYTLIHEE